VSISVYPWFLFLCERLQKKISRIFFD